MALLSPLKNSLVYLFVHMCVCVCLIFLNSALHFGSSGFIREGERERHREGEIEIERERPLIGLVLKSSDLGHDSLVQSACSTCWFDCHFQFSHDPVLLEWGRSGRK